MPRCVAILLLLLYVAMPVASHETDSLLVKSVLSSHLLPDYSSTRFLTYTKYVKTSTSLHNIKALAKLKKYAKKHKWLLSLMESADLNDSLAIPVTVDRRVERIYWRKKREKTVQEVLGIDRSGLNEVFDSGDILDILVSRKFQDFTLYEDTLVFGGVRNVSPIGIEGWNYYNYFINENREDSLLITFYPNSGNKATISGNFLLCKDSCWHIAKTNFLVLRNKVKKHGKHKNECLTDKIYISEDYCNDSLGRTVPIQTEFLIENHRFGIFGNNYIKRTIKYSDFSMDSIPRRKFRQQSRYSGMTNYRGAQFWAPYDSTFSAYLADRYIQDSLHCYRNISDSNYVARHELSTIQEYLGDGIDYINSHGWGWKLLTEPVRALINNFIEIGNPPKFAVEPVRSLLSFNNVDKCKLRFGGSTTANLNKHFFLDGYVAFGCATKNVYYNTNLFYSFVKKVYKPTEFPRRHIKISSGFDLIYLGERSYDVNHDDLLSSFQWNAAKRMIYYHKHRAEAEWDLNNGIGFLASIKREQDIATGNMYFRTLYDIENSNTAAVNSSANALDVHDNGSVVATEVRIQLMYYPKSKRFYTRKARVPINNELPSMGVSHTFGVKILGGDYAFHLTEINVSKDWYLGKLGVASTSVKSGALWTQVPFPLLLAPAANFSYFSKYNAFQLINTSEFVNDRYVQLLMSLETNGNLIGLIPLIKRLHWKEYVSVGMLWGSLSDRNNPTLDCNKGSRILMELPAGVTIMDSKTPYIEGTIGIHNIFHVINLDYIFRFTYRNIPNANLGGFRFSIHF